MKAIKYFNIIILLKLKSYHKYIKKAKKSLLFFLKSDYNILWS